MKCVEVHYSTSAQKDIYTVAMYGWSIPILYEDPENLQTEEAKTRFGTAEALIHHFKTLTPVSLSDQRYVFWYDNGSHSNLPIRDISQGVNGIQELKSWWQSPLVGKP